MTPDEFQKIRKHLGLSRRELGYKFYRDQSTIQRYEDGATEIPQRIAGDMWEFLVEVAIKETRNAIKLKLIISIKTPDDIEKFIKKISSL